MKPGYADDNDNEDTGIVDVMAEGESDSSGTDDHTIEVAKTAGSVNAVTRLPEKLGELLSGLHFLLVAKLVRTYIRKKQLLTTVVAKGFLIDKLNGIIHCSVEANVCWN